MRLHVLLLWASWLLTAVSAQRFMRQGFSNNEDFSAEMKLEDNDAAVGMTREMFLMQDLQWQLPPIEYSEDAKVDPALRNHINKYLGGRRHRKPVELKLFKKRGKFGLRAVGTMDNGKKLRAFWRQSAESSQKAGSLKASDFLKVPYDEAVRSRLFTVEFEVQLPPLLLPQQKSSSGSNSSKKKALPSVVYQVAVESGSMNPKAVIPRGPGRVLVYPEGRQPKQPATPKEIGTCRVGSIVMKAGIVDPSWSKGKPIFRKGRLPGLM